MLAWLVVQKWMRGEGLGWAVLQLTKSFFCANLCRMSQSNWITHSDTAKIQRGIRTQLVSCSKPKWENFVVMSLSNQFPIESVKMYLFLKIYNQNKLKIFNKMKVLLSAAYLCVQLFQVRKGFGPLNKCLSDLKENHVAHTWSSC